MRIDPPPKYNCDKCGSENIQPHTHRSFSYLLPGARLDNPREVRVKIEVDVDSFTGKELHLCVRCEVEILELRVNDLRKRIDFLNHG